MSSSILDGQRQSAFFLEEICIMNMLCLRSSCLACCLGGLQLDLVSPAFDAHDLFSISFLHVTQKAIPFPLGTSLGELVFVRRLSPMRESLVWIFLDDGKKSSLVLSHIDGVHEGLPFSNRPCSEGWRRRYPQFR